MNEDFTGQIDMKKILIAWIVPVLISIGLFIAIQPVMAQLGGQVNLLEVYLGTGNVTIGLENRDGFTQVYYEFNGEKVFITADNRNHRQPDSKGDYIVYVGDLNEVGQIFLYNILSGTTIQLTSSGINLKPIVGRSGNVAWEGWVEDRWQVFFYDGTSVKQLTDGDASFNVDIDGDYISYTRRDITGTYRSVVYSISTNEAKEVTTGISSKRPKVRNGKIILAGTGEEEEFPLTVDDIFLLDLSPLTIPNEVTVEEVALELEATPSAQTETEITPTPFLTPESETPTSE